MTTGLFKHLKPTLEKITIEKNNNDPVKLECDPNVPDVCGPDDGEPCAPAWGGACSPDLPPDTCGPDSDDDNKTMLPKP